MILTAATFLLFAAFVLVLFAIPLTGPWVIATPDYSGGPGRELVAFCISVVSIARLKTSLCIRRLAAPSSSNCLVKRTMNSLTRKSRCSKRKKQNDTRRHAPVLSTLSILTI